MCLENSLSRHFITRDVRAVDLKLFRLQSAAVFGEGMMMGDFRQAGMVAWDGRD